MTRDEIQNLKEGREMDALIAGKVMTLKFWKVQSDSGHFGGAEFTTDREWVVPGDYVYQTEQENLYRLPDYSTDIFCAWQIVERLENQNPPILCNISRISDDGTKDGLKWHCHLRAVDGANTYFYAVAETVPLAICAAALLAVMGGV